MTLDLSITAEVPKAKVMPMVLQWESWQCRLIRKCEMLHALGKPIIVVVRLGDVPPHWFKTVSEK